MNLINKNFNLFLFPLIFIFQGIIAQEGQKPVHKDSPFLQDYSIKYYIKKDGVNLRQVRSDRNGVIRVLSDSGLLHPHGGDFLYPGILESYHQYRPMADKNIYCMALLKNHFVYLDDEAILSNAWAGKLFSKHNFPGAKIFAGGKHFKFLVSDGKNLRFIHNSEIIWNGKISDQVIDIKYASENNKFWILGNNTLTTFNPENQKLKTIIEGNDFRAFDLTGFNSKSIIGTGNGYIEINNLKEEQSGRINREIPCPEITVVKEINDHVWFGSSKGAFMLRDDGEFNYYYGERWLPGNKVIDIAQGPDRSVLILTEQGLGRICFKKMTLREKAMYFEQQVRRRHIRYGFNATLEGLEHGDLSSGHLSTSDNDGLWTGMYLGGQVFRYAVTQSDEALQNCRASLAAMERLYTINPVPGFPSRSFERSGYKDAEEWQNSPDPKWDWKATTSSDEAIGHIFALGAFAELIDVKSLRTRAVNLIDRLMQHIIDHDLYLVDYDGKPTTWGRWNPEYVNARPRMVGDRKLNSSNIIAMLQTAYHFTGKNIYKEKAFELMHEHGYLENLMRPMDKIGQAPDTADDWSKMLSESWNHSDDEMYYMGYWGLYRYAFNDTLKSKYRKAIIDHWKHERPEKEGLWNIFTSMVINEFNLKDAIWYLQEHPLDLINWDIKNSHRKDIQFIESNFRNQTITEVLPPDERPIQRHNSNMFDLDKVGGNGTREYSAGDIWLLPYWLGRYLNVISEPSKRN
jgi:hypothetical protein